MATQHNEHTIPPNSLLPPKHFRQEIEKHYSQSYSNHAYVFPKQFPLSSDSSSDSSMQSLLDAGQYNLYSQNPHTSTNNTNAHSSKEASTQEDHSGPILDIKSSESIQCHEESRTFTEKSETKNKKVVSLGPEALAGLIQRTVETYKAKAKDIGVFPQENKQEVSESNKKGVKNLVLKIVKAKDTKEKSTTDNLSSNRQRGSEKKAMESGRKEGKSTERQEVEEPQELKQIKEFNQITKDFSKFMNHVKNDSMMELIDSVREAMAVKYGEDGRQRQEVAKQGGVRETHRASTSDESENTKRKTSDVENKDKKKKKEHKPTTKQINLYACYKALMGKPVQVTKVSPKKADKPKAVPAPVANEEKGTDKLTKVTKTVHLVKAPKDSKETKVFIEKVKETPKATVKEVPTKEKPREVKEVRIYTDKPKVICATEASETTNVPMDPSRTQPIVTKKANNSYSEMQRAKKERLNTEGAKDRKPQSRQAITKSLEIPRMMPVKIPNLGGDQDEESYRESYVEEKVVEEKIVKKSCIVESPVPFERNLAAPMSKINLKVQTNSIVVEYEERIRRVVRAQRKLAEMKRGM